MAAVVADTHAAVWYLLNAKSLSFNAQRAMDEAVAAGDAVYVSSISGRSCLPRGKGEIAHCCTRSV
jgi:PIN domain nuclease of toxin-antitoxin system